MSSNVNHRVEPFLRERRPVLEAPRRVAAFLRRMTVLDLIVNHQPAKRIHARGVTPAEPVQYVNVVRAFLEKKARAFAPVGVPVLEESIAAVADEVAAPAGLHLPDGAVQDQLAHLANHAHVPHVVAHVQLQLPLEGGPENPVAAGDGDRHRLFEIHRLARFQRGDGVLFVEEVRRGDEDRTDVLQGEELPVVVRHENVRPETELELRQRGGIGVGARDDADPVLRAVRVAGQRASAASADHADPEFLLCRHVSFPLCS